MSRCFGRVHLTRRTSLLFACMMVVRAAAFAPLPNYITAPPATSRIALESASSDQNNGQNDFFEEAAQQGAEEVAAMSIEERTKRAMLAEACEDRIVLLYDDLEELLGEDGLPSSVENRAEVEVLAREIKGLRQEYKVLVNGGQSPMLDSIEGTSTDKDGE